MSGGDREQQKRDAAAAAASSRTNEYFAIGEGIDSVVIRADICRYLGNDASVRPGKYEVIYENSQTGPVYHGYFITAYRNLTTAMIETLKEDSARWLAELAQQNPLLYKEYQTSQMRQDVQYRRPRESAQGHIISYEKRPSHQPGYAEAYALYKPNVGPTYSTTYDSSSDDEQADSGAGVLGSSSLASYARQDPYSGAAYIAPDAGASQGIINTFELCSPQSQTTLDLSRSKELYTRHPDYRRDATIWERKPGPKQRGKILFDTGCEAGNWVSMRVIQALQATGAVHSLPTGASFLAFDGNPVNTSFEIKLSFEVERTTFQDVYFYVLDNNGPFDMVVGATDCRGYGIVELKFSGGPHLQFFGGLVARGQTQDEKKQAEERARQQRLKEEQHAEERRKREKEKRERDAQKHNSRRH